MATIIVVQIYGGENMVTERIDDIMKKLEDHERRISALEKIPESGVNKRKRISIKEFILEKNPTDDVQKTLVIGYYLEHFRGISPFNTKGLAEGFREAREPVPININDKVNSNIAKAYMMDAGEKKDNLKAWVLTNSGERFVNENLKVEGI
jgi:nitrogen regulatory protein PII-like uncharacterized protein